MARRPDRKPKPIAGGPDALELVDRMKAHGIPADSILTLLGGGQVAEAFPNPDGDARYSLDSIEAARRVLLAEADGDADETKHQMLSLDSASAELLGQVRGALDGLVNAGALPPEATDGGERLRKTIQILAQMRLNYDEEMLQMPADQLHAAFTAIDAETDYCQECDKIYTKGTHRHNAQPVVQLDLSTPSTQPTQHMTGERFCTSAELHTLNLLANFSAFDKTIPFEAMTRIDFAGRHLVMFRGHHNETRGVPSREFFRCEVLMKVNARTNPVRMAIDVLPSWFVRLDEVDPEVLAQVRGTTGKRFPTPDRSTEISVEADAFTDAFSPPRPLSGIGKLTHDAIDTGRLAADFREQGRQQGRQQAMNVFANHQEADILGRDDPAQTALIRLAEARGLSDYRTLGEFDAWSLLATHTRPEIVRNRFVIAHAAVLIALGRTFNVEDVWAAIAMYDEGYQF